MTVKYQLLVVILSIFVHCFESSPANGFIDFDLMTLKAQIPRGNGGGLSTVVGNNELRIVSNLTFNCTGELTSMIIGVEVRRADLVRNRYPLLQLWRPQGDSNSLNVVESRDINLTPDDFNPTSVYELQINPPLRFLAGDVLGVFQPRHSRSLVRVFYVDNIDSPVQTLINDSLSEDTHTVSLSWFQSVRESLLIFPFTDPPMCSVGFLDRDTVVNVNRNSQQVVRSGGFQRVFSNINFSSNGSITKWIVGANDIFGSNLPELQIWRVVGPQFVKVGSSLLSPNTTSNTNIHVMYPNPPVQFQAGDIFGIFTPFDTNSSLSVLFQRFNGPSNRLMITLNPPAPTILPKDCIQQFYHGENNYPLVSVEVQALSAASSVTMISTIIISSPSSTLSSSSVQSSPTNEPTAQPLTDIVIYVLSGAIAGAGITILLMIFICVMICVCIRMKKKSTASSDRIPPQNSLRDNPCYGSQDNINDIGTEPHIDGVMYETIDVQTSLHNNPSYTSSTLT